MPARAAHGYAGRRAKEEKGERGELLIGTGLARIMQRDYPDWHNLARRMQGVHFLTKCQRRLAEVIQVIRG